MTICSTCKHANYWEIVAGGYSSQVKSCRDYRKGETTNEEWFCGLSTEEKAKFLRKIYRDGRDDYVGEWYEQTEADFVEWLKQPHSFE